jgi:hypothetical protein
MKLYPRIIAVGVLSAALLIAAVPAQARSLDRHLVSQPGSWFDAALSWLSVQLVGAPQARSRSPHDKATGVLTTPVPGHGATPMNGSCLDPNGAPRPCGGTGVGGGI